MRRRRSPEAASIEEHPQHQVLQIPTLTHLQFLVIDLLCSHAKEMSSPQVQGALSALGLEQRGPKFYQLMTRLAESGMIISFTQSFDIAGSEVQRTFYKATKQGIVAWRLTRAFYATRLKIKDGMSEKQ